MFFLCKLGRACIVVILIIGEIATSIFSDVLVNETAGGKSFDWEKLLHNWIFWVLLVIGVISYFSSKFLEKKNKDKEDEVIVQLEEQIKKISRTMSKRAIQGNFQNYNKLSAVIDDFQNKINRRRQAHMESNPDADQRSNPKKGGEK
ncbi:hypothetical protein JS518_14320 [Clostridiales bacterium FE2010]|nr:hypothetical protein JS518_14320 [Clostridiales bacterium FE2010]